MVITKKIIKRITSAIKLNSFYRRMFLLYASFTLIIILFTSTFLMNYLGGNLEKDIYAANKTLLEQIRSFSDTFLISEINVPLSEFIVDTYSKTSSNTAIIEFLFNTDVFNSLDDKEKELLTLQYNVMSSYLIILKIKLEL